MKSTELRLGNYLWCKRNNAVMKVEELGLDDHILCYVLDRTKFPLALGWKAEPIPLTVEWLVKFGFQVRESSTCDEWYIGFNEVTHDWLFSITWLDEPELIHSPNAPFYRNGAHHIFFVHQLQNLYFAITGEELTIKEQ